MFCVTRGSGSVAELPFAPHCQCGEPILDNEPAHKPAHDGQRGWRASASPLRAFQHGQDQSATPRAAASAGANELT